jgi:Flp pilus assembly protein TadD
MFVGVMFYQKGDFLNALRLMKRAMEIGPSTCSNHSNLGLILGALGDIDGAEVQFRTALRLNPKSWVASMNVGCMLQRRGLPAEAMPYIERAIQLADEGGKEYREARFNRGMSHLMLGRFREGWKEYEYRFGRPSELSHAPVMTAPLWKGEWLG